VICAEAMEHNAPATPAAIIILNVVIMAASLQTPSERGRYYRRAERAEIPRHAAHPTLFTRRPLALALRRVDLSQKHPPLLFR
jgi:hypothetical protein